MLDLKFSPLSTVLEEGCVSLEVHHSLHTEGSGREPPRRVTRLWVNEQSFVVLSHWDLGDYLFLQHNLAYPD